MTVVEVFSIICLLFAIILSGIIIKDCWEDLNITDSLSLRILLKIAIFLHLLLISLSTFFICTTIIS
ncbi:MAG: hypothetical protein IKY94_15550 [Lachnospiraceae bacterium]|nr:hypothetical protein [Lachnospiraceae bacterium]